MEVASLTIHKPDYVGQMPESPSSSPKLYRRTLLGDPEGPSTSLISTAPDCQTHSQHPPDCLHIAPEPVKQPGQLIKKLQTAVFRIKRRYKTHIRSAIYAVLFIAFLVHLAFAIRYSVKGAMAEIVITGLVSGYIVYAWVRDHFGGRIYRGIMAPMSLFWDNHWHIIKWLLYPAMVLAVLLYLITDVIVDPKQLQSLAGLVIFFCIPLITSKYPKQINWRTVGWGMALQFVIGCLVLRWSIGYSAIKFLAQEVNKFLSYSVKGGAIVFGNPTFLFHAFAMVIIPLVVYLGCVNAMLYYCGVIQWIAVKLGWLMSLTLQTTAIESISLVVNIFLSVVDVMLMLKAYLPKLTDSEFHCFLVAAHSTIAGFAFGLFVLFGVSPQHLMTGAVMSAPAAVAFAKLNFPETQESQYKTAKDLKLDRGDYANIFHAGVKGAWDAGNGVMAIMIQTISFVSLLLFLDASVSWCFSLVGIYIDLATIIGYLFMPFAFLMGVDWADTLTVGRFIGLKITANEFIAYLDLGRTIRAGEISDRSAAIATYAMCGFSSLGTLVIFTGVWQRVDPSRVNLVTREIPRIMMNANISCFMTACIASILYTEDIVQDEDTDVAKVGDLIRWVLDAIPGLGEIKQDIVDVFRTTVI